MERNTAYNAADVRAFYNAYGLAEWSRLEATPYGRLQAAIHTEWIERYIKPGDRVLDAGSGPGRFSIAAARLGGKVHLLDISGEQLRIARERLEEAGFSQQVAGLTEGDIVDLSAFPDGSFDLVLCYGGALSYVSDRREEAAAELVRVTRPGGILLVSVMSRFGSAVNAIRRGNITDPDIWPVMESGGLTGLPSSSINMQHPAMHLYSAEELTRLFSMCEMLEIAGSNVTATERMPSPSLDLAEANPEIWETMLRAERVLSRVPGLLDSGSHIILAARRRKA